MSRDAVFESQSRSKALVVAATKTPALPRVVMRSKSIKGWEAFLQKRCSHGEKGMRDNEI